MLRDEELVNSSIIQMPRKLNYLATNLQMKNEMTWSTDENIDKVNLNIDANEELQGKFTQINSLLKDISRD